MSPYRLSFRPPPEALAVEKDPFPTIACFHCRLPTTSMCGELACASCDLRDLLDRDRRIRERIELLAQIVDCWMEGRGIGRP
jgi:hypothetical protein